LPRRSLISAPCFPPHHRQVGPAFLELELHYETASTLLLRKVLDADKPEHRAILQEYGDESEWTKAFCLPVLCKASIRNISVSCILHPWDSIQYGAVNNVQR
jgi:hypothetical protein